jgi:hypothetical protein
VWLTPHLNIPEKVWTSIPRLRLPSMKCSNSSQIGNS